MIQPRDYQLAAHNATWNYLHNRPGSNPLVVMPTGTGKSLQMAMLIWHLLAKYPNLRIMNVTHVKELVAANYAELLNLWPAAPAGVYSAGLGVKNHRQPVTFAGIMSVAKKAPLFKHVDFLLIDEAHSISDRDTASYSRFISELRKTNPNLVVVGYTATPFRMKQGCLTNGELFDDICFDLSSGEAFVWLLDEGYLARPVPKSPGYQLNSDEIGVVGGDFDSKQTSQALRDQDILERAVDTIIAAGVDQGRQAWLHFCQSIEDAELVADMLTYKGHPHEAVHSKRSDRDAVLEAFQRGELRGVTNKDVLTTGYNQKNIDLMGVLRLTRSPGLWVQMVGRGTRPLYAPGYALGTAEERRCAMLASPKQNCLVLDFVGNTERLGPINYPRIPNRRNKTGGGQAVVRLCPQCDTYNHASKKICEECGYEFPPPERLQEDASAADLVGTRQPLDLSAPTAVEKVYAVEGVNRMVAMRHKGKHGKPDTMRVDYFCGYNRFSTWVCLEHPPGSFARRKAEDWWKQHSGGQSSAPTDIDEALSIFNNLQKPEWIKIERSGDFPSIEEYDFRGTRFQLPPELGGPELQYPPPDPFEVAASRTLTEDKLMGYAYDDEIPF